MTTREKQREAGMTAGVDKARALMLRILAWECFKDPRLSELAEVQRRLSVLDDDGCPACEGEDADLIDAELGRPYEDEGGTT